MKRTAAVGLSALSSLLLLGAFEPLAWDWLVWVALTPFLLALHGASWRRATFLAFVALYPFHFVQNYWVWVTVWENRAWLPFGELSSAGVALGAWVGAALTVMPAAVLFSWAYAAVTRRLPESRALWLAAPLWCFCEFARSLGALAHVWGNLGYALWRRPLMIQSADLGGVYLTAFLAALGSAAMVSVIRWRQTGGSGSGRGRFLALPVTAAAVLAGNALYGTLRLQHPGRGRPLVATVVQESIPVQEKANPVSASQSLTRHCQASERGVGSDLVVWPETAVPTALLHRADLVRQVTRLARSQRSVVVAGALDTDQADRLYNAALVFDGERGLVGRYYKRHLVPFGEQVPFQPWLPWLRRFQARDPEFTPGPGFDPVSTSRGQLGVCICFESMFPSICRELTANGAELLVILTNDDWYGKTFAPLEHAAMSAFRAVENRRWVVRAANTGVSCFFDSSGRLVGATEMNARTLLTHPVALRGGRTLYVRWGDWFPLICGAFAALVYLSGARRKQAALNGPPVHGTIETR